MSDEDSEDKKLNEGAGPHLAFFSEAEIALRKEIRNHPELVEKLKEYAPDDTGGIIGEIAAYVNIVMDGAYNNESLERLYPIIFEKLRDKRKIIITSPSSKEVH